MKKVRMDKEKDGMPVTALREVRILQASRHKNIVNLLRVVTGRNAAAIFLVFEYCEHDMSKLIESHSFSESEVKCLVLQLLQAVHFLHSKWIFHRDLKLSNLLLNNRGELKLCDFGLARYYQPGNDGAYTPRVVTLWYRAPELLLGTAKYDAAVDNWAVGCVLAELLRHEPLFPGKAEVDTLERIFKLLGSPNERIWPGWSALPKAPTFRPPDQPYNYLELEFPKIPRSGVDLLNRLLTYDPRKRCTAKDALEHDYFKDQPLPKRLHDMPTFPSAHDANVRGLGRESAASSAWEGAAAEKAERRDHRDRGGGGETAARSIGREVRLRVRRGERRGRGSQTIARTRV